MATKDIKFLHKFLHDNEFPALLEVRIAAKEALKEMAPW